jgi:uncharacterized protein HemY
LASGAASARRCVADPVRVIEAALCFGELYEDRAECYAALRDKVKEAAERAEADKWLPRSPEELDNRAWELLTGPLVDRDPKRALEMARKTALVFGDNPVYLNTLGVALYRNGRFTEAVPALEKGRGRGKGRENFDVHDLFFLAMCHARLGDMAKAQDCYDRAVKLADRETGRSDTYKANVKAFRAEAEEVLRSARSPK